MGINIKEALRKAASFLRQQGVAGPRLEAELMLAHLLKVGLPYLYAHGEVVLSHELLTRFRELCRRRGEGEPLAYIRGKKEFMGLDFQLKEGVFIPRPETELLVEEVLKWVSLYSGKQEGEGLNVLELGSGSGNIVVSLAYYLPRAFFWAVDLDAKALETVGSNSRRHGVEQRITILQGHYYEALKTHGESGKSFDIIVSNPPYIEELMMPHLPPEVQKEPPLALCGGKDGLDAYREIIGKAHEYLLSPGLLALELGAGQALPVVELARCAGFGASKVHRDLAGIERVLLLENRKQLNIT